MASWILSFDVGVKNLGYALIRSDGYVGDAYTVCIKQRVNRVLDTIRTMRELMASLDLGELPLSTVVVEKQLHRNPSMRVVQAIIQTYFGIVFPSTKVLEYSSRRKLSGEKCDSYRGRKKRAVELCTEYLDAKQPQSNARERFGSLKKKDDAADALLQGMSYLRINEGLFDPGALFDEDSS